MQSINKYRPLGILQDIQKEINKLFGHKNLLSNDDFSSTIINQWAPSVDIKEEPDQLIMNVDLPGV